MRSQDGERRVVDGGDGSMGRSRRRSRKAAAASWEGRFGALGRSLWGIWEGTRWRGCPGRARGGGEIWGVGAAAVAVLSHGEWGGWG